MLILKATLLCVFIVLILKATLLLCVHFGLQVSEGADEATQELHVHETTLGGEHRDVAAYRIDLLKALASKESVTVTVETVFTHAVIPYPQEITQVGVWVCRRGDDAIVCVLFTSWVFVCPSLITG